MMIDGDCRCRTCYREALPAQNRLLAQLDRFRGTVAEAPDADERSVPLPAPPYLGFRQES